VGRERESTRERGVGGGREECEREGWAGGIKKIRIKELTH